ncbi:MAG: arylsulfatase A-like enzyme [Pirellulaceae bacterium]|jgi:arylsulfatase A-like enzyme
MAIRARSLCTVILLLLPVTTAVAAPPSKPNILWIFSDDHAVNAIGAYGGRLEKENLTPNIDRIAADGMIFDRAYVGNSICAPSRATLLTGKHSHMNGKFDNRGGFDHEQQQFQKILQKNGYQTAMIGKIHLNGAMQGFDYWEVLPGQGQYTNPKFVTAGGQTQYQGHSTDIVTDRALNWLETGVDESKPFMMMVHYKAPHRNWLPAERIQQKFRTRTFPEPDTLFDDYSGRGTAAHGQDMSISTTMRLAGDLKANPNTERAAYLEQHNPQGKDLVRWKYQAYMQDYLGCVAGVDENIGRILAYLKEHDLEKNTIVMYSSDQGFYLGEHGWFDKRFMYEESFRTPLVAKWPGVIKPGQRNHDLVQNIDFAETFLDIAGAPIPDDMQGKSLVPLFTGSTPDDWRQSLYYQYYEYPAVHSVRRHEGVFDGRFKLIRFYGADVVNGEEWELFDLTTDPGEMQSIYKRPEQAAKVAELKTELERLKVEYKVPENGGLPLRGAGRPAKKAAPRANRNTMQFQFKQGDIIAPNVAPYLPGRGLELTVPIAHNGKDGVLIAQGGASNGFALWIKDGFPQWTVKRNDQAKTIAGSKKLTSEAATLVVKQSKAGAVSLKLNASDIGNGSVGGAFLAQPFESLAVGQDDGTLVGAYDTKNRYTGKIGPVAIQLLE